MDRHGTDTQRSVNFELLQSLVWNGGVWNRIQGLVPDLWIGSESGCAFPPSGQIILSGSHTINCLAAATPRDNMAYASGGNPLGHRLRGA